MSYGGFMKHVIALAVLMLTFAAAQNMPQTYTPLVIDLPGVVQVDCRDLTELPEEAACFEASGSPQMLRSQLDLQSLGWDAEWAGTWQRDEDENTTRVFHWNGDVHMALVAGGSTNSYLVLVSAEPFMD